MPRDIKKLVKECDICQANKHENVHPPKLLQLLPIPKSPRLDMKSPWLDISIDFVKGLSTSGGYTIIFSIIDRLTKFAHFFSSSSSLFSK